MSEFFGDLARALKAWAFDPRLLLLTVIVYALMGLSYTEPIGFVGLPVAILSLGFFGAQRVWYVKAWDDERWPLGRVLATSWACFLPFLGLALLGLIVAIPIGFLSVGYDDTWVRAVQWGIVDMIFTFVPPALLFTSRLTTRALAIGLKMIRDHWRHALPYVMVPPLMIQAIWASPEADFDSLTSSLVAVGGGVVGLLFKGATLSFYLRHRPLPEVEGPLYDDQEFTDSLIRT